MKTVILIFCFTILNLYSVNAATSKIIECYVEKLDSGKLGCFLDTTTVENLRLSVMVYYGTTGATLKDIWWIVLNGVTTNIYVFPKFFFTAFTNLAYLKLNGIKMNKTDIGAFTNAKKLENLTLGSNEFTSLTKNMFSGASVLKELILDSNKIATIEPGAFNGLGALLHLSIRYNKITSLEANTFAGLTNLKILYLLSNLLTNMDVKAFVGLSKLEHLNFGYNPMTSLRQYVFDPLVSLKLIRAYWNKLKSFPVGLFAKTPKLNWINFASNLIQIIPNNLFDNLVLNYLGLDGNVCVDKYWAGFDTSYVVPLAEIKAKIANCSL
jgi:hypothetical protein